jgi:cell division transport system permease protein
MARKPMASPRKHPPAKQASVRAGKPNTRARPKRTFALPGFRIPRISIDTTRHAQMFVASLGRLVRHPLSTMMTVAVIGIALALPAGLQLLVSNGRALSGHWDSAIEISVYLEQSVSTERAAEYAQELRNDEAIADVRLISADDAFEEFRQYSGFGTALDALTDNPLPNLLVLRPAPGMDSEMAVASLGKRLELMLPAEMIQTDTEWVGRFHAMLDLVKRVVALAAALLALGVLIIVGNTIRLDIQNRRDEIEVTKLIGATDAFIRRPFLYTGAWYGFFGGLFALGLVTTSLWALEEPVGRLAGLYGSKFQLAAPEVPEIAVLVVGGTALGWLGSWVSATRNMRRIEPGE